MVYNRNTYCLNNPLKYTDSSGYSWRRFWEIYQEEQKGNGQGTRFFNNYVNSWENYVDAISHKTPNYYTSGQLYLEAKQSGYHRNFNSFLSDLSKQIIIPESFSNHKTFTWHTWESSHWVEGGSAIICETKIIHTITINASSGGGEGLLYPVSTDYPISSGYTENNRTIAELNQSRPHRAIDLATPVGTPIASPYSGTVTTAQVFSYGMAIIIQHDYSFNGQSLSTSYSHLSQMLVNAGDAVTRGCKL